MNNEKVPSLIRWTKSDYGKLSYAVREFNKKIKELEDKYNELYNLIKNLKGDN